MKALSVRPPWWWFILHGGKDIENRDWSTDFRGRVLLHASKWWRNADVLDDMHAIAAMIQPVPKQFSFATVKSAAGCLVGSVEIVDCVEHSDSPWFFGRLGFVLRDPVAFERPIPFKGALGFFEVADELIRGAQ